MSDRTMTCDSVDELLPDYLEDALNPHVRATIDEHAVSCARCAALIAELRAIARQARALPPLTPSRDLWDGIAARIEAPVVAIDASRDRSRWRSARWRLPAAAAALVALTAGITYTITVRSVPPPSNVALGPADSLGAPSDPGEGRSLVRGTERLAPAATVRLSASATYDREIERLRTVVQERRALLDSATVAVIDYNLKVIDQAITQSRAALEKDPGSGFLNEQLNSALDKKLTLMRTAALLPART